MTTDLIDFASASDLARGVRTGLFSSTELVRRAIARIEALDERLNAVVVRDFERALEAAADADRARTRNEERPLLGVPMTVKESYAVAGLRTTWGMPDFATWTAPEDAVAVARLKAAGAIVLGKTNVPYALGDWQSYNDIYGTTNNPFDVSRTPGGSSGGSAAAVAAGYVSLEMGSDIGGSLRAPAHYCGIFSHKPSRSVVPVRGHAPPGTAGLTPDLAVVGPLARTARDLALAMETIAGPDDLEATGYRLQLPPQRRQALREYRVLLLDSHPVLPASADVRAAFAELSRRLRGAGVTVSDSSPLLPDLEKTTRVFVRLLMPVVFSRLPVDQIRHVEEAVAALAPDDDGLAAVRLRATISSHRDWLAADAARIRLAREWRALFETFDVVLFPPMPTVAYPHDHTEEQHERRIDVDGTAFPYLDQIAYSGLATPPGLPATTIPIGRSRDGLPIGAQIIGPFLEDRTTLHVAELLEREFGGFTPPSL